MKIFSNFSNILFWVLIFVGVIFLFQIPSSKKNAKFKVQENKIFPEVKYPFLLPDLKFSYSHLEPYMDAQTVEIHYTKHHQWYIDNLNKCMEQYPEWQNYSLEDLLANLNALPEDLRKVVKSHGGGHFNHTLFWISLHKKALDNLNYSPVGVVLEKINKTFGSFENFKKEFMNQALGIIGSGWVWLCVDTLGDLRIVAKYNHDTPLARSLKPILILDVWEHAYYLKYQNKRADFVKAWWNLIDWSQVDSYFVNG